MYENSEIRTWKRVNGLYKCGNCGHTPTCVEITDLVVCPHCGLYMKYYETVEGMIGQMPEYILEDQNHEKFWH